MPRLWKTPWLPMLIGCLAGLLSTLSLKDWLTPFFWIGVTWSAACVIAIFCLRKPRPQGVAPTFFNVGFIFLLFGLTELYLSVNEAPPAKYSRGYYQRNDTLGTSPVPGVVGHSTRMVGGKVLYNVAYSIDSLGLRVAPPMAVSKPSSCVLFFGGSFTFGEGLHDNQTVPYQVGIQSSERIRTYNFGFHGYGPNEMLSEIEHGIVGHDVACRPDYALYTAIPSHVARVAGKVPFEKHAPRYELDSRGVPFFDGHFDDSIQPAAPRSWLASELDYQLGKSAIYRLWQSREPATTDRDIKLFVVVVNRSRDLLAAQYPGIKFEAILWFPPGRGCHECAAIEAGLRKDGIPTHQVADILPGFRMNPSAYTLRPNGHPNALADSLLASYVVNRIVAVGSLPN